MGALQGDQVIYAAFPPWLARQANASASDAARQPLLHPPPHTRDHHRPPSPSTYRTSVAMSVKAGPRLWYAPRRSAMM